jgi:glycosyltransferase involved in cell wall biosynthesis
MLGISVIVCAHNPRPDYLRRTLDALPDQDLAIERWELTVVDNASEAPLARDWDLTWHPSGHHFHEVNLGLAFARRRGIAVSHAKILVFVHDDNVLAPNYLSTALLARSANIAKRRARRPRMTAFSPRNVNFRLGLSATHPWEQVKAPAMAKTELMRRHNSPCTSRQSVEPRLRSEFAA